MAGNDDDSIFRPVKLGDDVVDGKLALRCVGREDIVLYRVAFEMCEKVTLDLFVVCAAEGPRTISYDFFHILHSAIGIDRRDGAIIWRKGTFGSNLLGSRGRRLRPGLSSIFIPVASHERQAAEQHNRNFDEF